MLVLAVSVIGVSLSLFSSYNNDLAFPDEFADLPISLPEVSSYKPAGDGELSLLIIPAWVNLPNGNIRETDTMPGYAGQQLVLFAVHGSSKFQSGIL